MATYQIEFLSLSPPAGAADADPPAITFSPLAGAVIPPTDVVTIQVTDASPITSLFVAVQFLGGTWEIVHDGASFTPRFAAGSSGGTPENRVLGIAFPGGWPAAPVFKVWAGDVHGNLAQASAAYALPALVPSSSESLSAFDPYLATEGLRTAVIISLFSDRRADDGSTVPAGDGDLRGWWGDAFSSTQGDRIGSRLWLLDRSTITANLSQRAQEYAKEALAWMLEDNVASKIDVSAAVVGRDRLDLTIEITQPQGDSVSFRFAHVWEAERAQRFDLSIFEAAT